MNRHELEAKTNRIHDVLSAVYLQLDWKLFKRFRAIGNALIDLSLDILYMDED